MQQLHDYAMMLGVSVEYADLTHLGISGDYHHESRAIRLQDGMVYRKHRTAFGHELGHATRGDVPSMFPHIEARQERHADEWAAHFLFDEAEYRIAEEKYGARTDWIAQELCVLERLVIAYERTLHRIGDEIYVSPKMGAGQWARKVIA